MPDPVRWYNRLAAWLWERSNDLLLPLALPAWELDADRDAEMWERVEAEILRRAEEGPGHG